MLIGANLGLARAGVPWPRVGQVLE
jgi:hypothetical protein